MAAVPRVSIHVFAEDMRRMLATPHFSRIVADVGLLAHDYRAANFNLLSAMPALHNHLVRHSSAPSGAPAGPRGGADDAVTGGKRSRRPQRRERRERSKRSKRSRRRRRQAAGAQAPLRGLALPSAEDMERVQEMIDSTTTTVQALVQAAEAQAHHRVHSILTKFAHPHDLQTVTTHMGTLRQQFHRLNQAVLFVAQHPFSGPSIPPQLQPNWDAIVDSLEVVQQLGVAALRGSRAEQQRPLAQEVAEASAVGIALRSAMFMGTILHGTMGALRTQTDLDLAALHSTLATAEQLAARGGFGGVGWGVHESQEIANLVTQQFGGVLARAKLKARRALQWTKEPFVRTVATVVATMGITALLPHAGVGTLMSGILWVVQVFVSMLVSHALLSVSGGATLSHQERERTMQRLAAALGETL